jgi:hypothetical protein
VQSDGIEYLNLLLESSMLEAVIGSLEDEFPGLPVFDMPISLTTAGDKPRD